LKLLQSRTAALRLYMEASSSRPQHQRLLEAGDTERAAAVPIHEEEPLPEEPLPLVRSNPPIVPTRAVGDAGGTEEVPDSSSRGTFQQRIASWVEPIAVHVFSLNGAQLVEPLPDEVVTRLRCLRLPVALGGLLSTAIVGIQCWCMCDAVYILWRDDFDEKCQLLRCWLISYCIAVVLLLFCAGFALPLLACCIMIGQLIRARLWDDCQHSAAAACGFADVVMSRTLLSLTMVPVSAALLWLAQWQVQIIRNRWGRIGPASEEIINWIATSPPADPCGAECIICLSDDTELLADWRELPCGHQFHLGCLRGWLKRSRQCPICRLDLHPAFYLAATSGSDATSAVTPASAPPMALTRQ